MCIVFIFFVVATVLLLYPFVSLYIIIITIPFMNFLQYSLYTVTIVLLLNFFCVVFHDY